MAEIKKKKRENDKWEQNLIISIHFFSKRSYQNLRSLRMIYTSSEKEERGEEYIRRREEEKGGQTLVREVPK